MWTVGAAPHEKKLAAIIASAIEIAPLERIVFFGSAARGEMVEDGDLDLLVVADTRPGNAWHAGSARRGCGGAGFLTHYRDAGGGQANRHDPCC